MMELWKLLLIDFIAFLLNNGRQYHYAHAIGLAEYFLSSWLFPVKWDTFLGSFPWLALGKAPFTRRQAGAKIADLENLVTLGMVIAQGIRSLAMIQAAQSFSHIVKSKKHDDHMLVTHGLYS